jgi:hypothetical protein
MSKRDDLMVVDREAKLYRSHLPLVDKLMRNGRDFLVRETPFMTTLIYDGREIIYTKKSLAFPPSQLWIFRNVNSDATKFAEAVEAGEATFSLPEKHPTNHTNLEYDDTIGEITGTDVNSAYWTIAHQLGVISTRTYEKAGQDYHKVTRLAALAILGRTMAYKQYKGGKILKEPKLLTGNKIIKDFYRAIRYKCYEHMQELAKMLGDDFEAYRTDCIYYRDSPENRQMVYDYLDNQGFTYKQLVFEEPPEIE